jgi:hypothetical protein
MDATPTSSTPTTLAAEPFELTGHPGARRPAGKTGQAAVAEAAIKADLDTAAPDRQRHSRPAKTSAPGGAKTMVIGDGTEAATGDSVTSKKDGKTYTFVKPKGQYAVVTDPNGDTPNKQLLKLASTMTQPGKAPAGTWLRRGPEDRHRRGPGAGHDGHGQGRLGGRDHADLPGRQVRLHHRRQRQAASGSPPAPSRSPAPRPRWAAGTSPRQREEQHPAPGVPRPTDRAAEGLRPPANARPPRTAGGTSPSTWTTRPTWTPGTWSSSATRTARRPGALHRAAAGAPADQHPGQGRHLRDDHGLHRPVSSEQFVQAPPSRATSST